MPTTVANKYVLDKTTLGWDRDTDHFVYIGRGYEEMHFGNPFSTWTSSLAEVKVNSREEAIEGFKTWLAGTSDQTLQQERRQWILDNLGYLVGKTLVCFCHPKACHGDIYCQMVEELEQ